MSNSENGQLAVELVMRGAREARTACGFCLGGVYRGRPCPYCDGTGDAPQERGRDGRR